MSHAPISKNHLFRLNSSISRLLMFAKPGVMSKKLLQDSPYNDRGVLNEVRKAVVIPVEPEEGNPMVKAGGGRYMPSESLSPVYQRRVARALGKPAAELPKPKTGLRPILPDDRRNIAGATEARKALYDKAKQEGISVGDRDKEMPVRDWVDQERRKIAQETGTRRKLLQAIRKRESEVNGEPRRTGYKLTDRERQMLSDAAERYGKINSSLERSEVGALRDKGKKYLGKITKQTERALVRNTPAGLGWSKAVHPDVLRKRSLDLVSNAIEHPVPPASYIKDMAGVLGVPESRVNAMRDAASRLIAPGADYAAQVKRYAKRMSQPVFGGAVNPDAIAQATQFPVRPKGWKGPTVDVTRKSFPTLKKLGIVAGIIGGGVAASKMLSGRKKKDEEQKMLMSSKASVIQFARGDRLRALLKVGKKAIPSRVVKGAANEEAAREIVGRVSSNLMKHYRQTPFAKKLNTERSMRELKEQFDRQQAGMAKMAANIEAQKLQRISERTTPFTSKKQRKSERKQQAGLVKPDRAERNPDGSLKPRDRRDRTESVWHDRIIPALEQGEVKDVPAELRSRVLFVHGINKDLAKRIKDVAQQNNDIRRLYNPKVAEAANERAAVAERGVAEMQRTYRDRVQKEVSDVKQSLGEQHKKDMFNEESRRYKQVAIGTGLGLVGGAALGSSAMREADENKSKQKQLRFERGEYDDAKRMAISSAVTGAAGGGIVASLLRPRDGNAFRKGGPAPKAAPLRKQLNRIGKAAFKAGAFMGAAGLASSLVGRAILGKPDKRDAASATKSGAVGGAVVGGLSGAALGALAGADPKKLAVFGLTKKAAGLVRRNKNWLPIAAMGKGGSARRALIGGAVGTLAGAAQMADEGQQADTLRNLKKPTQLSSKLKSINFSMLRAVGEGALDGLKKALLIPAPFAAEVGAVVGGVRAAMKYKTQMRELKDARAFMRAGKRSDWVTRDPDLRPIEVDRTGPKTIIRRVGEIRQSAKGKVIRFAEAPLSGKLAADRYRKKIQDEDLDRRDANIMRTALAGAALGGLLKGRRGAAAGAGAGALLVPLIRTRTESGKDMYGERTREGKRAEGIPWKAAALGAGALAAHKGINRVRGIANRFNVGAKNAKKAAKIAGLVGAGLLGANLLMKSKLKTIQFRDEEDIETDREFLGNPEGSREWRKGRIIANKAIVYGKRGTRLAKDIVRAVKGEKNVDSRGRERQREWDKPWVRKMVLTGILATGALGARRIVKGTAEGTKLAEARDLWQSGAFHKAAAVKFPRIAAAKRWLVGTTDDAVSEAASGINQSGIMGRINKWGREGAEKYDAAKKAAARGAAGEAAGPIDDATEAAKQLAGAKEYARIRAEELKKGKIIEGKFSKPSNQRGVIRFISNEDRAPGWDTRREGDLVLLKDIRRRERREKKLLERKDWQDTVVTPAKMTASWLGGMGLMAILHKGGRAAGSRTSGGAGAAVTNDRSIYADKLWEGIAKGAKRRAMGMSSVTKDLIALSSLLDEVL